MSNASSSTSLQPKRPWTPLAALIMVAVGFLALPFIAGILISIMPLLFGWSETRTDQWLTNAPLANFLYVLLTESLTLAVLVGFIRARKASVVQALGLVRPHWRDIGYTLAGVVVYFLLFVIAITIVDHILPINTDQEQALGFDRDITGAGLAMAFASLVILPPIIEEMMFRGFFYGTVRRRLSVLWSSFFVSIIFGALHLFGAADGNLLWIAFLDTFVLSLVLCYLREKTGSIVACIGVHAIKNGIVCLNLFILSTN